MENGVSKVRIQYMWWLIKSDAVQYSMVKANIQNGRYETLPKALRTQALTTLTSFVGLVWLSMFGLVDLVW